MIRPLRLLAVSGNTTRLSQDRGLRMGWPRGRRGYAVGGVAVVLFVGVAVLLASCSPTRNGPPKAGATARATTTAKGSTGDAPIPPEAFAGANACKECHESS